MTKKRRTDLLRFQLPAPSEVIFLTGFCAKGVRRLTGPGIPKKRWTDFLRFQLRASSAVSLLAGFGANGVRRLTEA